MTNENQDKDNIGSFYMGRMRPPPQPERVLPKGGLSVVAVLVFLGIVWYAYPDGDARAPDADVPVIVAEKEAYKFQPDDPGGMQVRHQDSTVFDPLEGRGKQSAERLLPKPEEPVDTDKVIPATVAAIEKAEPELKLDMQVEEIAEGTEKFIARAEEKTAEAVATAKTAAAPVVLPVNKPAKPAASAEAAAKASAIAPAAGAATKPVAAAQAGSVYIQLGSYRDASGAETDWKKLQKKYPEQLGSLSMRTERVDLGAKGVFNRLQAGKLTEARAKEVCDVLKSANAGGCMIVR